ncbi:MAG: DUF1801 domain-containing protein [Chloroflexota bacterium]|nr:DUF1801 domain-containing protein [Chloroflexota bacterium]
MRRPAPGSVDAYIAAAPKTAQPKLKQLRALIKRAAPNAEEKISYGMPYYGYKGRLIYFAGSERYVALYAGWPATGSSAKLVAPYRTSKGTLKFPVADPLPAAVITKIVKARVKENEGRERAPGTNAAE